MPEEKQIESKVKAESKKYVKSHGSNLPLLCMARFIVTWP